MVEEEIEIQEARYNDILKTVSNCGRFTHIFQLLDIAETFVYYKNYIAFFNNDRHFVNEDRAIKDKVCVSIHDNKFYDCTNEEKLWLKECIKANKLVNEVERKNEIMVW